MPAVLNPETLIMAKAPTRLLQHVKINLAKLCDVDQMNPSGNAIELIKWRSKYKAEIMDLCSIEIVQIEGMRMTENISKPVSPATD